MEKEIRETNRRLEEALAELKMAHDRIIQQERLRALGQIASGIAHDLNNALAPILGFAELLLMRPENLDDKEKAKYYLEMISTAAKDAANVVARLKEFYRQREEKYGCRSTLIKSSIRSFRSLSPSGKIKR